VCEGFQDFSLVLESIVEMSTRDGDDGDQNTKVKLSVLMAPGKSTETEWPDYSVEFDPEPFGCCMDFKLYKSVLDEKS
jgi:hypothetical protein